MRATDTVAENSSPTPRRKVHSKEAEPSRNAAPNNALDRSCERRLSGCRSCEHCANERDNKSCSSLAPNIAILAALQEEKVQFGGAKVNRASGEF